MGLFDDIKKYFALLGIKSHKSTRKNLFNAINVLIFVTHGIDLMLSSVYISKVAEYFGEYVDAFFRHYIANCLHNFYGHHCMEFTKAT